MTTRQLALFGGTPIRTAPFKPYRTIDDKEIAAVVEVMKAGVLSDYLGSKSDYFLGGRYVRKLEETWAEQYGVRHAIAMNSATSGIIAALGAIGIGPGDEVIVSPYSHVISATAPLFYGAVPVFADLEPDYFCLSIESIKAVTTPRTKAILLVDTLGQSSDMDPILAFARERGIFVINDSAHITVATYMGKRAGTLSDVGIYSLNSHKTIQCGEGGVCVTNDNDFAFRMQLIRNHAENCVEEYGVADLTNMVGYNFRMNEIEAAITLEQLKKAHGLIAAKRELAEHLTDRLRAIDGITPPAVRPGCTHDYMTYSFLIDPEKIRLSREEFLKRLNAEGIPSAMIPDTHFMPVYAGYVKPIYRRQVFVQKAFFKGGGPWTFSEYTGDISYDPKQFPVTEDLFLRTMLTMMCVFPANTLQDMDDIANAIEKVVELSR